MPRLIPIINHRNALSHSLSLNANLSIKERKKKKLSLRRIPSIRPPINPTRHPSPLPTLSLSFPLPSSQKPRSSSCLRAARNRITRHPRHALAHNRGLCQDHSRARARVPKMQITLRMYVYIYICVCIYICICEAAYKRQNLCASPLRNVHIISSLSRSRSLFFAPTTYIHAHARATTPSSKNSQGKRCIIAPPSCAVRCFVPCICAKKEVVASRRAACSRILHISRFCV